MVAENSQETISFQDAKNFLINKEIEKKEKLQAIYLFFEDRLNN